MTYWVKQDKCRINHLFKNKKSMCDGLTHPDYSIVAEGMQINRITCEDCVDLVPAEVAKVFNKAVEWAKKHMREGKA